MTEELNPTQNNELPETPAADPTPVQAETASPETQDEHWTPNQKAVNFTESQETTAPLAKEVSLAECLALMRESFSTVQEVMTRTREVLDRFDERESKLMEKLQASGKALTDEDGSAWFRTFVDSLVHAQNNLAGEAALTREGSEWTQSLDYEGRTLRAGQPKQKLSANATPEQRLNYLSRKAGVGTVFDVPLPHSGLWLRFKSPSLAALTGLQYELNQLKVTLGSDSKGMAFSNTMQSLMSCALDFALQYVIDSNVHYTTPSDLKEKIKLLDAPMVLWGLAVTLYPKGYPYAHACVADPAKCNHVTKELLNLNRLFWMDSISLTQTQRKLLARRFDSKLTEDEQRLYQSEAVRGGPRLVWFNDGALGLTLRSPSVLEFEEAGRAWIQGIIDLTQGAFNEPPHGRNRDQYITRMGIATTARQYAHWVASVHERDEDGEEQLISDESDVINMLLDNIFSTEEYAEEFLKAVTTYMDDSMVGMVAIPSFNCPRCNTPAAEKFHERFPHLVPLDVLTTFFTLVSRKHR